ncbi:unnamed protein product [Camellia sinensis]
MPLFALPRRRSSLVDTSPLHLSPSPSPLFADLYNIILSESKKERGISTKRRPEEMKMDESANYCEKRWGFLLDLMKALGLTIETIDLLDLMVFGDTIETIDLFIEKRKMDESAKKSKRLDVVKELIKDHRVTGIFGLSKITTGKRSFSATFESGLKISRNLLNEKRKMDESANYCEKRSEGGWIELTEEGPRVIAISAMGGVGKTTLAKSSFSNIFESRLKTVSMDFCDVESGIDGNSLFDFHLLVLDYKGKIAFTSTKQFQTSTELPPLNSGGFVVMDISYDLPHLENVDISNHGIVQEPRAMITWDLTKQKIKHPGDYSQRELFNGSRDLPEEKIKHRGLSENLMRDLTMQIMKSTHDDCFHRGLSNGACDISIVGPSVGIRIVFLLVATLIAATTCQVPFHFLGSTSSKEVPDQFKIMRTLFILCNSMVFIASVGVVTFLLHEFPLKPWPHISISALFGSYMLSLNAIMPNGALALFFISIPILLIGICRETLWLCKP